MSALLSAHEIVEIPNREQEKTLFAPKKRGAFLKGRVEKAREMAKGLLEDGVPISIISKRSGLTESEIKSL